MSRCSRVPPPSKSLPCHQGTFMHPLAQLHAPSSGHASGKISHRNFLKGRFAAENRGNLIGAPADSKPSDRKCMAKNHSKVSEFSLSQSDYYQASSDTSPLNLHNQANHLSYSPLLYHEQYLHSHHLSGILHSQPYYNQGHLSL